MIGALVTLITPFLAFADNNFGRNILVLFGLGFLVDLSAGWLLGLTNLFLALEMLAIFLYQRDLRLRIRVKIILGIIFSLGYLYVSRRVFF